MESSILQGAAFKTTVSAINRIERTIDDVTERLATGLKVNSALDNPDNFFQSRALKQDAGDLQRRIDAITQSIRTIESADNGVTAITENIEQAQAIVFQAIEAINNADRIALVTGDADLSEASDLTALAGITTNQTFDIVAGDGEGGSRTATFTITAGTSASSLAAQINGLTDVDGKSLNLSAQLTDEGFLQIRAETDDFFQIDASNGTADLATITALGLGYIADQNGNFTAFNSREIRSQRLFRTSDGAQAQLSDRFRTVANNSNIRGEDGRLFQNIRAQGVGSSDVYRVGINQDAHVEYEFFDPAAGLNNAITFNEFVSSINAESSLSDNITASFDDDMGQLILTQSSEDAVNIRFSVRENGGNNLNTAFGFGTGLSDQTIGVGSPATADSFVFGVIDPDILETYEDDLAKVQNELNSLTEDAGYRGVNLLAGDDMKTFFNSSGSSFLITEGTDLSAIGLGINALDITTESRALHSLSQLNDALSQTRMFGSSLANNLGIVNIRSDFTNDTIATYNAGADDLTLADANEEGANLLAAQTRQALATTTLSLVSQSQATVLRLF